jgi:hypothetical protein
MPSHQVHLRYPVPNLIPESSFPLLPSGSFPTAKHEYRTGRTCILQPIAPSSTLLWQTHRTRLAIGAPIEVGFGLYRQRVRCSTPAYMNAEARIYDPLYLDITDLPSIESILHHIAPSLTLLVPSKAAVSPQHKDDTSTLATSQKYALGDNSSTLHSLSQSLEAVQIASSKTPTMLPPPDPSSSLQTPTLQGDYANAPSQKSDPPPPDEVTQEYEDWLARMRKFFDEEGFVSSPHLILFSHPNLTM